MAKVELSGEPPGGGRDARQNHGAQAAGELCRLLEAPATSGSSAFETALSVSLACTKNDDYRLEFPFVRAVSWVKPAADVLHGIQQRLPVLRDIGTALAAAGCPLRSTVTGPAFKPFGQSGVPNYRDDHCRDVRERLQSLGVTELFDELAGHAPSVSE